MEQSKERSEKWSWNTKVQGRLMEGLHVILRVLDFIILRGMGSHGKILSKGVTLSNLCFRKFTQTAVWEMNNLHTHLLYHLIIIMAYSSRHRILIYYVGFRFCFLFYFAFCKSDIILSSVNNSQRMLTLISFNWTGTFYLILSIGNNVKMVCSKFKRCKGCTWKV